MADLTWKSHRTASRLRPLVKVDDTFSHRWQGRLSRRWSRDSNPVAPLSIYSSTRGLEGVDAVGTRPQGFMSTLGEIEFPIEHLPSKDKWELLDHLHNSLEKEWDQQIES